MKRKEIQPFYIYKISTEDIMKSAKIEGSDIVYDMKLTYQEALSGANIVAIGDNQVLMQLRKIMGKPFVRDELRNLEKEKYTLQHSPTSAENIEALRQVESKIFNLLFVPELITVQCKNKKDYKSITSSTFLLNGEEYIRFACGSGQTRRNSPTFVMKKYFKPLQTKLLCGLGDRIKTINVAKFNAYFGLYMSSFKRIPMPKFCVVKDCEVVLPNEHLYWINSEDNQHYVTEVEKDLKMNTHDGMGLVSPEFNERMKEKTKLDWEVCNWVVRGPFIKGLVVPFDFKKFIQVKGASPVVKDVWGNDVNLNDVDMIFTESQVKMWKYYYSYEDYVEQILKNELFFGVARYNKREDAEYSLLNYQYIQTLDLDRKTINELIEPTIQHYKKVCEGDVINTLYFLLGAKNEEGLDLDYVMSTANINYIKGILYNPEILKDPYIKNKIYQFLENQIQKAKLGRVYVRGNYQTMIADPVALMENILGLEVKGALKRGEIYSKWWLDRKVKQVDACRSPMVCQEEHNVVNIVNPFEQQEPDAMKPCDEGVNWYQYITSGIIYNVWDCSTIIHSDSDKQHCPPIWRHIGQFKVNLEI